MSEDASLESIKLIGDPRVLFDGKIVAEEDHRWLLRPLEYSRITELTGIEVCEDFRPLMKHFWRYCENRS